MISNKHRPPTMVTTDRRQAGFASTRRPSTRRAVVGVDGGGTKTRAVILAADFRILGEGLAGASNPLRVGIANAATAIREAIDRACETQSCAAPILLLQRAAGWCSPAGMTARMREALLGLGIGE